MRARARRSARATGAIDRTPQHLPLSIGGLSTVHQRRGRARWRDRLHRHGAGVAIASGSAAAIAGAYLSLTPPTVEVFAVGNAVHVGSTVLLATPGRADEYRGDAALVVNRSPDGTVRAAASGLARGAAISGSCVMSQPTGAALEERCEFRHGSGLIASTDRFALGEGAWRRRYDDGQEILIAVPSDGAVVPVPFAIGRN